MAAENPRKKAKERRQKLIAAGGAVVLLALLAFEGPGTLKRLHGSKTPTPIAISTTPSTSSAQVGSAAGAHLIDTAIHASAGPGQLRAFTLFTSKDPFAQQIDSEAAASGPAGTASSQGAGPTPSQPVAQPPKTKPAAFGAAPPVVQIGRGPKAARVIRPGIVISMNGVRIRIATGESFPSGDPIFWLVSFKPGRARLGVTGGSFADGSRTVLLVRGKTLTLLNTTASTSYKLKLVSWTTRSAS
jgi:hypothetical protein